MGTKIFKDASNLQRFIVEHESQFKQLTEKEVEVLTFISKGLKNPAIAKQMKISRNTVQNHRAEIRRKLSVECQADYIKHGLAFGLISF